MGSCVNSSLVMSELNWIVAHPVDVRELVVVGKTPQIWCQKKDTVFSPNSGIIKLQSVSATFSASCNSIFPGGLGD